MRRIRLYEETSNIEMADVRYQFVSKVTEACLTRNGEVTQSTTDKIDKIVLNRCSAFRISADHVPNVCLLD